jgi:hypothetical protein
LCYRQPGMPRVGEVQEHRGERFYRPLRLAAAVD